MGVPSGLDGKESACNAGDPGLILGSGRSPGEGHDNPLHILAGEFHGKRSPVGYSPWGHKELDMTEQLSTAHIVTYGTAAILQLKPKIK